jgi:hypothetical protein
VRSSCCYLEGRRAHNLLKYAAREIKIASTIAFSRWITIYIIISTVPSTIALIDYLLVCKERDKSIVLTSVVG